MKIKETKQKTSEILAEMRKLFSVYSYYDDKELDKQFPPPEKITEREFLDNIEPDPQTLGKSAREADPEMKSITLRERLLMEIQYFKETGEHLDIKGWTICSGSRYSGAYVPGVYWSPDTSEVCVYCYFVDYSYSMSGLRSAVSLSTLNPLTLESRIETIEKKMSKIAERLTLGETL